MQTQPTFPVSNTETARPVIQDILDMMCPYEYNIRFVSLRVICPNTQKVFMEAQRAVDFIHIEPDWEHLDDVVSTFLEAHGVDVFTRLESPRVHADGGWMTHSFDMGSPRVVWILLEKNSDNDNTSEYVD